MWSDAESRGYDDVLETLFLTLQVKHVRRDFVRSSVDAREGWLVSLAAR